MEEKKIRTPTIHKKDMVLDKVKLKQFMDQQGVDYTELHRRITDRYGLDLTYKGFMNLLSNRATWKLLYAHAIAEVLRLNYNDFFQIIDVDVDKVKKEKEIFKKKYPLKK